MDRPLRSHWRGLNSQGYYDSSESLFEDMRFALLNLGVRSYALDKKGDVLQIFVSEELKVPLEQIVTGVKAVTGLDPSYTEKSLFLGRTTLAVYSPDTTGWKPYSISISFLEDDLANNGL